MEGIPFNNIDYSLYSTVCSPAIVKINRYPQFFNLVGTGTVYTDYTVVQSIDLWHANN